MSYPLDDRHLLTPETLPSSGGVSNRMTVGYLDNFISSQTIVQNYFALDKESTKLMLPASCVTKTIGLQRTHPTPSLCRLFLQGRCRQDSKCHQIHADPDAVLQLRQAALASPPCCQMHTPWAITSLTCTDKFVSSVAIGCRRIPVAMFCPTAGLDALLKRPLQTPSESAVCTGNDLCRNHRAGAPPCRYGDDCNYLHLCTILISQFADEATLSLLLPSQQQQQQQQSCNSHPTAAAAAAVSLSFGNENKHVDYIVGRTHSNDRNTDPDTSTAISTATATSTTTTPKTTTTTTNPCVDDNPVGGGCCGHKSFTAFPTPASTPPLSFARSATSLMSEMHIDTNATTSEDGMCNQFSSSLTASCTSKATSAKSWKSHNPYLPVV